MKINILRYFTKKKRVSDTAVNTNIISDDTAFNTLEAYKTARTNIMFSLPKTYKGKVILVTSAEPGEGKTTTSINIAHTFAKTDAKVILVDCDLRKPRVHRYLKFERDKGVSNVLCGFNTVDEVIKKNVMGNLDCISAGEIPTNSTELLMSDEMGVLIDELSRRYDYVFIDTPPVMTVTDAMIIAPKSNGVVIVVKQEQSSFDMLDKTVEAFKQSGIKILGFIFNGFRETGKRFWNPTNKYKYAYHYMNTYEDKK